MGPAGGIGLGRPGSSGSSSPQVPADCAEEGELPPAAATELAAQKREQRLRKVRELHLKRVSGPGGIRDLSPRQACARLRRDWEAAPARLTDPQGRGRSFPADRNPGSTLESL